VLKDDTFDRRKFPRVRTESLVSIARLGSQPALASALDLSRGGIRFQCVGLEVEQGERLRVTLTLGDQTVDVTGVLVRVTELDTFTQEVALSFGRIDNETLALLELHLPDPEEFPA
jgi:hypothetical protein